jgi:hypothetical protein
VRGPLLLITMMIGGSLTFVINLVCWPVFYLLDPWLYHAHA